MGSIRPLREDDDRSRFQSGDSHLDRYFQVYAGQNQFRHHVSATWIYEEGGPILGYVTVAAGELKAARVPRGTKKLPAYPLPILRVARLAVCQSAKGRGIGAQLLRHSFHLAVALSTSVGCIGVLVDPKPGAEAFYRRFGFMETEVLVGDLLTGVAHTPLFLPLAPVKSALSRGHTSFERR